MRKFLAWLVLTPLALIVIVLAVANRRTVTLSIDPFSQDAPAYAVELPLFIVILGALIAGVLIGGTAVWFGKLRWKLAAHRAEREAASLRAEKAAAQARTRTESSYASRALIPPP
ncbi:MAG: DUF1049 domain-containing protein [Bradyrhizobiaceae bacterium]|nr:DUF1049 domain-containing protein [Bradyrhizobiaceae bacterium]